VDEKMVDSIGELCLPTGMPDFYHGLGNGDGAHHTMDTLSTADCHSMTTSQYDAVIHEELERTWILNLSMHFRDKSKREKFFVTYRERPTLWRRVTISVDYRNAPENSLELELAHIKFQRDKIAKIYDAIRESLIDIQFYPTVTNLKLQTTEGRLHVHVVEDVNVSDILKGCELCRLLTALQEIIHYPSIRTIQHMRCNRVKERDIDFDSHISGFVYKVRVNDEVLIKKEIPGPDTVDEFLYEINALNRLKYSNHVIKFYGVIVDDDEEYVKGLLISHAEQGALIDVIYDQIHPLPWSIRERWARQIVSGLSEIHEAGFVQGDFTLSNIVIDDNDNAKIIDINRRGCPVGWEPPEATPLIESNQRISMYIGVKSDIYQLGMVLWALAMKEDEPEAHGRPLRIGHDVVDVPDWFRRVVDICLSEDPRGRMSPLQLLSIFPELEPESEMDSIYDRPSISVDDGVTRREYFVEEDPSTNGYPLVRTVQPASDWSYVGWGQTHMNSNGASDEPFFHPTRGRSPPSPLPSNPGEFESSKYGYRSAAWASMYGTARTAPSESDAATDDHVEETKKSVTPRESKDPLAAASQMNGVEQPEEKMSLEDGAAEENDEEDRDMPDDDEPTVKPQMTTNLEMLREPRIPRGTCILEEPIAESSHASELPQPVSQEDTKEGVVGEQTLVGSADVQDVEVEREGPPETGITEPEAPANNSNNSSAPEAATREPEPEYVDLPASSTDPPKSARLINEVGILPESVPLPQSGPPSENIEDIAETLPHLHASDDKMSQGVALSASVAVTTLPEHSLSESVVPSVPDDLKGVGSTYDMATDKRQDSINDNDLALLIQAEQDGDRKNDSSDETPMRKM
jgi:serine/threonine protein kinase